MDEGVCLHVRGTVQNTHGVRLEQVLACGTTVLHQEEAPEDTNASENALSLMGRLNLTGGAGLMRKMIVYGTTVLPQIL